MTPAPTMYEHLISYKRTSCTSFHFSMRGKSQDKSEITPGPGKYDIKLNKPNHIVLTKDKKRTE